MHWTSSTVEPGPAAAIAVRRWDDFGKVDGLAVPGLHHYEPVLRRVAGP